MSFIPRYASAVAVGAAILVSACSSNVTYPSGEGGASANGGGPNTGGSTTTVGPNSGGANTGGTNTGGSVPVDCVTAESFDPCSSPGSYCMYYDAGTNEYCEAYCDESLHWQKYCYTEPTYCYNPSLCPTVMPTNGAACQTTSECEYYDCEYSGACGGTGYGVASCQNGVWYTFEDCYCYQPMDLCPTAPPQSGTTCATTQQCQSYDCEWYDYCGAGTYAFAYCDGAVWYSGGDCL